MKDVIQITIKGSSGYGPYDKAYEDKVIICSDAIRYEYVPKVQNSENITRKWSYRTTSPMFLELFRNAVLAVEEILNRTDEDFAYDVGMIAFSVIYSDKTRTHREFFLPSDEFKDCFMIIKHMVPSCEEVPDVLQTSDDR